MSEMSDAFDEMLDAQEESLGRRERCVISGKAYDFLVGDTNLQDIFVDAGIGKSGAYVGKVRVSDFPKGAPVKFESFQFRGDDLQITNIQRINDTYEITASDVTQTEGD